MNKYVKYTSILIMLMAFAATAAADYGVTISQPADQTATEGVNAIYVLTVTNTGNTTDTYTLSFDNIDSASTVALSKTAMALATGASEDVNLDVANTAAGTFNVTVTATSANATATTGYIMTTVGTASTYGVTISQPADQTATEGVNATYVLTVTNTGNTADTYTLSFDNIDSASAVALDKTAMTLATGASEDVNLNVANTAAGTFNVTVTAASPDATATTGYIMTTVGTVSTYGVTISQPTNKTTDEGVNATCTLTVTNTGNTADTYNLTVQNIDGASTVALDKTAMTLATGASEDVNLDVANTAAGTFNVTVTAASPDATATTDYIMTTVSPSGHSTGFRIWDADKEMDCDYTWDARSFTGFYYDLDDDTSTETLTIHLDSYTDRTIEEDDLKYITTAADIDFECSEWGTYKVIGFMAEKYFAGYEEDKTDITNDDISLVSKDMLSKVLIDEDEKHTISTGASLELKEGYELKIIQLDTDGNQAQIELLKNGKSVDSDIVRSPDTYVYTKDLGKLDDVPLVVVHIDSVFAGMESDMLVIEGIFQISDDYISVDTGDEYDDMEIKSSSGYTIEMRNIEDIDLEEGEIVDIMGNLKFLVADSSTLRFALYEEITEPGTHDIRGTVYDIGEPRKWDHMNFEGFYYDIDDDLGTEELWVEKISGNTIDEGDLIYTTTPDLVRFDLGRWGSYEVIGFMAERYFAGYDGEETDDEITNDDISLISKDMLSKVLVDVEDDRMISTGASLPLYEGYELKIIQLDVDGGQAQLELLKNGKSVDTDIVRSPDTYVYTKDLGKLDDVPIIAIRISNVFAGMETDMVTIEGAFQISDDPISIDTGDEYGEMEITSASSSGITMKNKENDIDLEGDETIMITDNIGFKVSDDEKRYYLFVRRTIGSLDSLEIEFSDTPVVDEELTITVTAASDGDPVEGVEVTFEGENLGLTDSDGKVRFTSEEAGTFTITAAKKDYDPASEEIRILTEDEVVEDKLEIAMLEEVEPDEDVVIKVTSDGDAIEGASIIWDGDDIGETDETGSLTYTAEDAGTYTVTASKAGYLDASEEITVAFPSAEFELADLTFPAETSTNKKFTVTVDVANTGDANGTYNAELMVDGTVADSKSVDLDAGETTTVEFTHKISDAGTYTIEIGSESGEIAVTKAESNTALVAAALIVLAALGAIGYVLISSTPEGGWTVERLIEAIKDKFRKGGERL